MSVGTKPSTTEVERLRAEVARLRSGAEHHAREIKGLHTRWYIGEADDVATVRAMEQHAIGILMLVAAGNAPESPEGSPCWACKGKGSVTETSTYSLAQTTVACGHCGGRGKVT
jgi:hypothetical protein